MIVAVKIVEVARETDVEKDEESMKLMKMKPQLRKSGKWSCKKEIRETLRKPMAGRGFQNHPTFRRTKK